MTIEEPKQQDAASEEQDWTSPGINGNNNKPFTPEKEVVVLPLADNVSFRPVNILPRSNSLDNNYLFRGNNNKHEYKILYSSTTNSNYDDAEEEEEEEQQQQQKHNLLVRSYSVDCSNETTHHRFMPPDNMCWKLLVVAAATNNNYATTESSDMYYPDMTHASKKAPLLLGGHEIRIIPPLTNHPYGGATIHAFTVRGATIILATSHYTINSFHINEISCSNILLNSTVTAAAAAVAVAKTTTTGENNGGEDKNNNNNNNTDNDIIRSICFSPAIQPKDDNRIIWAGTENGSILAMDITKDQILVKRMATHSHPITFIKRHRNTELWTLDQGGSLNIWPLLKKFTTSTISSNNNSSSSTTTIDLLDTTPERYQITPNCRTAILSYKKSVLWCSAGRSIDKFDKSLQLCEPLIEIPSHLGEIIQLVQIPCHPDEIYALHTDGKMTGWNIHTCEKIKCCSIVGKLTSIASVGNDELWVGYDNGIMAIYDTSEPVWKLIKMWKAHMNPIVKIEVDDNGVTENNRAVVSMDATGHLAIWDGLLAEDWFEQRMLTSMPEYADTNELKIMISSWNMDAVKPDALTDWDVEKLHEWLNGMTDPDIIMIGVQEIVDLASKTITAKSLLALSKRIDTIKETDGLLTHRYLLWYNYFSCILSKNFGPDTYTMVKTDQLVGLFSCIFIKKKHEHRIRQCDSTNVKTGFRVMTKGLHGNKGGIATRLIFDDSSLCFVNCHLASGQTHILQRNADLEGILNSAKFPSSSFSSSSASLESTVNLFSRETDGSSILDHETCFLSGDLNYRISMPRDQVLDLLIQDKNKKFEVWEALLGQDQFKKQQAINPLFRLYNFKEAPILFDPTYKYDRGTDIYDSSEKKRVPAWCDRILYRAATTYNLYYKRHEVRASDHRPISAGFIVPTKTILQDKRVQVKEKIKLEWQTKIVNMVKTNKVRYVINYDLCDENEAQQRLEKAEWDIEKVVLDLYHDKGCFI